MRKHSTTRHNRVSRRSFPLIPCARAGCTSTQTQGAIRFHNGSFDSYPVPGLGAQAQKQRSLSGFTTALSSQYLCEDWVRKHASTGHNRFYNGLFDSSPVLGLGAQARKRSTSWSLLSTSWNPSPQLRSQKLCCFCKGPQHGALRGKWLRGRCSRSQHSATNATELSTYKWLQRRKPGGPNGINTNTQVGLVLGGPSKNHKGHQPTAAGAHQAPYAVLSPCAASK